MELASLTIPAINRFASLYLKQEAPVTSFFHYDLSHASAYEKRAGELAGRTFYRHELANCIESYMKKFSTSAAVDASIEKLRRNNSLVVIGGQQAGLLTGPLYTIHKIISIIKLAEEQEKMLNQPVVPVFWIAGEDHDFLEVNHVYIEKKYEMEKVGYPERVIEKRMVSDIHFDRDQMKKWVRNIFTELGETDQSKGLLNMLDEAADRTESITDFFSYIIHELFSKYGLLLIDSANPALRRLEAPFFEKLITHAEPLTQSVLSAQDKVRAHDFSHAIDLSPSAANLFLYEQNERVLLEWNSKDLVFIGKNGDIRYTKEELLQRLAEHPEVFSNNVVTRPLMQEWLFPTLAFIAGPGEIAYWAELKEAFELLNMNMPPIVPRLNMTLLERNVARDLSELGLSIEDVLIGGVAKARDAFWESVKDHHFHDLVSSVSNMLTSNYEEIRKRAEQLDRGLLPIVEKNKEFHLQQLEFLQRKSDESLKVKHHTVLNKFARIECSLRPNGGPQERTWNIFYFLNEYGYSFIDQLMGQNYIFDGSHQLIKI